MSLNNSASQPTAPTDGGKNAVAFATAFSPDGERLVCATNRGVVSAWDLSPYLESDFWSNASEATNRLERRSCHGFRFAAHTNTIYAAQFASPDLLLTGADEEIRAWRLPAESSGGLCSLECEFELRVPQLRGMRGALSPVAETNGLSVYGGKVVAAAGDGNAYVWNLATQQLVSTLGGQHTDYLHCVVALPKAKLLATGSEDGTLRLWDERSSRCVAALPLGGAAAASSFVACAAADPGENWLAFGGQVDGAACVSLCHIPSRLVSGAAAWAPGAAPVPTAAAPSACKWCLRGRGLAEQSRAARANVLSSRCRDSYPRPPPLRNDCADAPRVSVSGTSQAKHCASRRTGSSRWGTAPRCRSGPRRVGRGSPARPPHRPRSLHWRTARSVSSSRWGGHRLSSTSCPRRATCGRSRFR